jgi:GNAT superfamily N-acetyltransferase
MILDKVMLGIEIIRSGKIEMVRKVTHAEFDLMLNVINDASEAYRGVIPKDRWKEPYMSAEELADEIKSGVEFYGQWENRVLVGVMGIQPIRGAVLIRHAYVLTEYQRKGIGNKLLKHLLNLVSTSVVFVGTWEAASWAVRFYEKNGFRLVSTEEKDRLLGEYWNIPKRQVETSVVLKLELNPCSASP